MWFKYVLTRVGQFSEWVTSSLDISPGYIFTYPLVLKISDKQFLYITMVFKKKKKSKNRPKNWRFVADSFMKTVGSSTFVTKLELVLLWDWIFFRELKTVVFSFWIFSEPELQKLKEPPNTAGTDQPLLSTYLRVTNFLNNCLHTVVQWQVQHFSVWIFIFYFWRFDVEK